MTFAAVDTPDLQASPGSPLFVHPKCRMKSGLLVDCWNLDPADVRIDDIAFNLSNETRYGGAAGFYSVGQHSLLVSEYFHEPLLQLAGLLHDAEEAYLKDMMSPIKARPEMAAYKEAGKRVRRTIWNVFGLGDKWDEYQPKVKVIDEEVYFRERASFAGQIWGKRRIIPVPSGVAYRPFLHKAIGLLNQLGIKYV